jgi:hypothetical protein
VDEATWLKSRDPMKMLKLLQDRASVRKLRLFVCAEIRRVLNSENPNAAEAIDWGERLADGEVTWQDVENFHDRCRQQFLTTAEDIRLFAVQVASCRPKEVRAVCDLARCIFGNPFQSTSIDPEVLRWSEGTVPRLAQSIYEDRRWEALPILGDALEDAGCDEPAVLAHCRHRGPHARGCHVLDLILGKE